MTYVITTTLAKIRAHSPCAYGYRKLCKSLGSLKQYGGDTPVTFSQIYNSNGYDDTLWCLRATDTKHHNLWRNFAVDCAEQVRHLMTDKRSIDALDIARKHADRLASDKEMDAAIDAARDTWPAWHAAWPALAAARAALAAWDTARVARAEQSSQITLLLEYCRTGERVMNPERFFQKQEAAQ